MLRGAGAGALALGLGLGPARVAADEEFPRIWIDVNGDTIGPDDTDRTRTVQADDFNEVELSKYEAPGAALVEREWDFDNGETASGTWWNNPDFSVPGEYEVTLDVRDSQGRTNSFSVTVISEGDAPDDGDGGDGDAPDDGDGGDGDAPDDGDGGDDDSEFPKTWIDIDGDTVRPGDTDRTRTVRTGERVEIFLSKYEAPAAALVEREWDFGNGETDSGGWFNATTYDEPGEFEVTLDVRDSQGRTNSFSVTIVAEGDESGGDDGGTTEFPKTWIDINGDTVGPDDTDRTRTVSTDDFHEVFLSKYEAPGAALVEREWNFDNGETASGTWWNNPNFGEAGEYEVTLDVRDSRGRTNSFSVTVVSVPPSFTERVTSFVAEHLGLEE